MSEERVLSALRALAESSRDQEAPPEVETRLIAAFRRSRRMRIWKRAGLGAAAAAAVLAVVVAANHGRVTESPAREANASGLTSTLPQVEPARTMQQPEIVAEASPRTTTARGRRIRTPKAGGPPVPDEVATDFFPLMDVAPPFGRGEIVRIVVPAAAMQSVGLPVREERLGESVQADVLLGEEGMARAIRFVNFTH